MPCPYQNQISPCLQQNDSRSKWELCEQQPLVLGRSVARTCVQHCNVALSLNALQLSFPIHVITARCLYRLTAHLIGIAPPRPWPKANLSTKGALCNFTYVPHSPRAKWVSNLPRLRRFATDLRFSSAPVSTDLCVRPMCALWVYFMGPVTRNMHWATRDLWLHDQNILLVQSWSKFARGLTVAQIIVMFSGITSMIKEGFFEWDPRKIGVALGCRASAIIYRKTRVYGDYQWIIAINASARPLTLQPIATPRKYLHLMSFH